MAVIEEVPLEGKKQETPQNFAPGKPPSSDTTTNSGDTAAATSTASGSANVGENDSDGFETASERDMSDNDDDNQEEQLQCDNVANDEEANQEKALALANDSKLEGNRLFVDMKFEEALVQYDIALQTAADLPSSSDLRSICHSNRAVCFLKLGKYEETVKECTKALEINPSYVKALRRRAEAHEKLEHFEEAIAVLISQYVYGNVAAADMKKILELDPSNDYARPSITRLEPMAAEKREKMKEEMMGKLKEMGNSLLGRFGMSVDNFKAVKDPNTGSYSISFQN
ncbi:Tetratricopeptide repeat protein 1 [Linum grandiflorum]